MLPTNPRAKIMAIVEGSDRDNWGVRRRVELAKSSVLSGVFLRFEVVTALTDVTACLQTWALKTGLLSCIRADRREKEEHI